ncbi:MAG TPA: zinc ribbon domain-containing protein [Nitrospirota bacterium]|nr:zinc ribbon domain-containing protein [Nitrospirota bacterium]
MPFYEYQCEACGWNFMLQQSMSAKKADVTCPRCNEKRSRKVLSAFSSTGGGHSVCGLGSGGWGGG